MYSFLTQPGFVNGQGGYKDDEDAIANARYHMAQNAWDGNNTEACLAFVTDKNRKTDLHYWIEWQLRYRSWRGIGKTDVEAHALATAGKVA